MLTSDDWRSSDFVSNVVDAADAKVYYTTSDEPDVKKRKRLNGDGEYSDSLTRQDGGSGPIFTGSVSTNKKLKAALEILRTHCESLVDGCVCHYADERTAC